MRFEDVLALAVLLVFAAFVLLLLFRRSEQRHRDQIQRNETLRILVQKFNTSDEFVGFVNSEAGRQLLSPTTQPPKPQVFSTLRFVQVGVVLIMIGLGMLVHAHGLAGLTDPNFVHQREDLNYWGTVASATGFGLLVVAGITRWLSRKWGLFDSQTK
jgi:Na+/H+ antiporter NhaD/arsenite permease-like protein